MISPPETVVIEESPFELEDEKRGPNRWVIAGAIVFVIAFLLGWRSVRSKKSGAVGAGTDDSAA